ncbi:MAG TPA: GatB/YqeY domain-containing protein [Candidatus Stackebrandtia excrementipullorum]|nr:GatB/YqeY domain-containing protein [Candidatus Stackebrandtia excrementipullorum]
MSSLKTRLETDMKAAMKSRDELVLNTLRMVMTAIRNAEVSGASVRELSDNEVQKVIAKQAKQRKEAADAFENGGRPDQAARERAEEAVLVAYLPQPLTHDEIVDIVDRVLDDEGFREPRQMGQAMKAVQATLAGRADGKVVAGLVKARLTG